MTSFRLQIHCCKARWLNLKTYFHFGPILTKCVNSILNFASWIDKIEDTDFAHVDGMKIRIPSEIKPSLTQKLFFQKLAYQNFAVYFPEKCPHAVDPGGVSLFDQPHIDSVT